MTGGLRHGARIEAVRAAAAGGAPGASEAIADALAIGFAFSLVNRLADAFAYEWDSERHRARGADALVGFGYRLPGYLLR